MTEPQINTKDVVLRLDQKVDGLVKDMADLKVITATVGSHVETLHDHEMRIRVLERFRFAWPSTAILGVAGTLALAAYTIFH